MTRAIGWVLRLSADLVAKLNTRNAHSHPCKSLSYGQFPGNGVGGRRGDVGTVGQNEKRPYKFNLEKNLKKF